MGYEHVALSGPHYLQSTIAQAYIAGATEKIRLNSCVTVLPRQHPIVLAKANARLGETRHLQLNARGIEAARTDAFLCVPIASRPR
jgi:Luciferase-like monooxygenase